MATIERPQRESRPPERSVQTARLAALALIAAFALTACDRRSDGLFGVRDPGVTSASMLIPQVDTEGGPTNRIFVSVTDGGGSPMSGFQVGDFSILEGGEPGVPFEVGPVFEPLYLVLVIDRSGSMIGARETAANTAAVDLVNALSGTDFGALVEFSGTVRLTVGFTANKTTLVNAINGGTSSGSTALYDAVAESAAVLQSQAGRRLMVVLTDGDDTASTETIETAIAEVNRRGQSAVMVGLGSSFNTAALQQIAVDTDGSFHSSADGTDLSAIFLAVLERFNNLHYVKYRRRQSGPVRVFLNYGAITTEAEKRLD